MRITSPCTGWISKKDVVLGQVCVVNSLYGATVREGAALDTAIVGEIPFEERVFVVEREVTSDGKERARVFGQVSGWLSLKCIAVVASLDGELQGVGEEFVKNDETVKAIVYSHYTEVNHEAMYKALYDAGETAADICANIHTRIALYARICQNNHIYANIHAYMPINTHICQYRQHMPI